MSECKAPDCDNATGDQFTYRGYCSNTCWNVGLEAAAKAVQLSEPGDLKRMDDLGELTLASIRRRNERAQKRFEAKIEVAEGDS